MLTWTISNHVGIEKRWQKRKFYSSFSPLANCWFLEAGKKKTDAAKYFGIERSTISKIWKKYTETHTVDDKKRTCRLRKIRTLLKKFRLRKNSLKTIHH